MTGLDTSPLRISLPTLTQDVYELKEKYAQLSFVCEVASQKLEQQRNAILMSEIANAFLSGQGLGPLSNAPPNIETGDINSVCPSLWTDNVFLPERQV